MAVLAVSPGAHEDEVRTAYRRLLRASHPDVAADRPGADATRQIDRLTQAYAVARAALAERPDRTLPGPAPVEAAGSADLAASVAADVIGLDQDSLLFDAPADVTFAALFEAAGRVGHVAYFDRQLGILETVVRFEGGPTCSVLITLQGRAYGTEAFCTMESIEAAPTPPIAPVMAALAEELTQGQASSPNGP